MKKILLSLFIVFGIYSLSTAQITIFEDFDSYTPGDDIVQVNPTYFEYWPGGNTGLEVSDAQAASGSNSIYLFSNSGGGPADVIMNFQDKYETGTASLSFMMYVTPDHGAYFNIQAEATAGSVWASNVSFFRNGTVEFGNSDNTVAASAIYPQGEWFEISYKVNLDENVWELSLDGRCLVSYANPANSFASMNLFPFSGSGDAEFWFDNISFEHSPDAESISVDASLSPGNDQLNGLEGASVESVATLTNNLGDVITSAVLAVDYAGTTQDITLDGLNLAEGESTEIRLNTAIDIAPGLTELLVRLVSVNGVEGDDIVCNNELNAVTNATVPTPRKGVLAEEATGTWCPQCPRGAVTMEMMEERYGEYFVGIAVHNADPMVVEQYDAGISTIEGFTGYPNISVNRTAAFVPGNTISSVENPFLDAIDDPVRSAFVIGGELNDQTNVLNISIEVEAIGDLNFADNLVVAIVEDHVTGTDSGYDQANANSGTDIPYGGLNELPSPIPASMMVYDDVARALLTPFEGIDMGIESVLSAGGSRVYNFTVTLSDDWDQENLLITSFVTNSAGEVDNAIEVALSDALEAGFTVDVNDPVLQSSFEVFPNPVADLMNVKLESSEIGNVRLELFNIYGQVVHTEQLQSFIGKQNWLVNISELPNGVYTARVRINDKTAVQIVQKLSK